MYGEGRLQEKSKSIKRNFKILVLNKPVGEYSEERMKDIISAAKSRLTKEQQSELSFIDTSSNRTYTIKQLQRELNI